MYVEIQTDGASHGNPGPAAIGVVVKDASGRKLAEVSESIGRATNNQAEYRAIIVGLKRALSIGAAEATLFVDSELALRQLTGKYRVRNKGLLALHAEALELLRKGRFRLAQTGHFGNLEAHALAQAALKKHAGRSGPHE